MKIIFRETNNGELVKNKFPTFYHLPIDMFLSGRGYILWYSPSHMWIRYHKKTGYMMETSIPKDLYKELERLADMSYEGYCRRAYSRGHDIAKCAWISSGVTDTIKSDLHNYFENIVS